MSVVDGAIITTKTKRGRSTGNKGKVFVELYNKICESVSLLGDLLDIERLTDTIVLQVCFIKTFSSSYFLIVEYFERRRISIQR